MIIKTNAQGKERKRMALVISQWTGHPVKYAGAPTFNYEVGGIVINKDAGIDISNTMPDEAIDRLVQHLINEGFEIEDFTSSAEQEEKESEGPTGISIQIPWSQVSETGLENLFAILDSKGALIKKALGVDALPVNLIEDRLDFPWFPTDCEPEDLHTYMEFVTALCNMANKQKRVNSKAKDEPAENEKYAFRCFLLRLGFIGDKYKVARKILLRNLNGNTAFRTGAKGKEEAECE